MRPAVFLDRDDTLIANRSITGSDRFPGSLFDPEVVRLLPGAAAACAALKRAGYVLVVVTNQGCVARGECTIAQVEATNRRMCELVEREGGKGAAIDAVYSCPYHPKGTVAPWNVEHPERKPNPGMLIRAAAEMGLDLSRSWMIGDAERDIQAAVRAGIAAERTVLVGESGSRQMLRRVRTILEAAELVLENRGRTRSLE